MTQHVYHVQESMFFELSPNNVLVSLAIVFISQEHLVELQKYKLVTWLISVKIAYVIFPCQSPSKSYLIKVKSN